MYLMQNIERREIVIICYGAEILICAIIFTGRFWNCMLSSQVVIYSLWNQYTFGQVQSHM